MGIKNLKNILIHSKNIVRESNVNLDEFYNHFDFMQVLYTHLYSCEDFASFYKKFKQIFNFKNKLIYIDANYDNYRKEKTKSIREKSRQCMIKKLKNDLMNSKIYDLKEKYEFSEIENFDAKKINPNVLITEDNFLQKCFDESSSHIKYFQYMITLFGIKNLSSIIINKLICDNILNTNELVYEDIYDAETKIVIDVKNKYMEKKNNIISGDQDVLFLLYYLKVDKCLITSCNLKNFYRYKFSTEGLNISKLSLICNLSDYWDGIKGIEFNVNNYEKFTNDFIITFEDTDISALEILKTIELNFMETLKLFSLVRNFTDEKYNNMLDDFKNKFKDLNKYLSMEKSFYYK